MLLIETYIDTSPGKGIGLFAKKDIEKGTKYWLRNEVFDTVITEAQLDSFHKIASDFFTMYGFLEVSGNWYLCNDHARFSNHSETPNTQNHFNAKGLLEYCTISKNIKQGEEIFINYTEICMTCREGVAFKVLN